MKQIKSKQPVETVPGIIGWGWTKENEGGDEFKYDVLDILQEHS
jgi:hypothetical protein